MADTYFEDLATSLIGGAQARFVRELTLHFLKRFKDSVTTANAQDIARFETLARLSKSEAIGIFGRCREHINADAYSAFERALSRVDEDLLHMLTASLGRRRHATNLAAHIAHEASQGMAEILYRQNIALAEEHAKLWYEVTGEALGRIQSGDAYKAVMEAGVQKLLSQGLTTVDYVSGVKTTVDAALRRHIVTQANQARNRLLFHRMDEWQWDLVFVSAHFGARPSHAEWQGQVYSRSGKSKVYPPLVESTGYGTVTGLCGANCRHTMTPYVEGYSQLPNTDWTAQEKFFGYSSEERYKLTQTQRRLERSIRETRREKAALDLLGFDSEKQSHKLNKQYEKLRTLVADHKLTRDYLRERPWGMPIVSATKNRANAQQAAEAIVDRWMGAEGSSRRKKKELIRRAIQEPQTIFFYNKRDTVIKRYARNAFIREAKGRYPVAIHGTPHSINPLDEVPMPAGALADIIRQRQDYQGEDILLLSCSTGKVVDGTCVAQELADIMKVNVYAPPEKLWMEPTKFYIETSSGTIENENCLIRFSPKRGM